MPYCPVDAHVLNLTPNVAVNHTDSQASWGVIKNPHEPGHCTIFRRPRVPFVGPNFHKWKFFDALCSMDTLFSPTHNAELHVPDVGGMHCVSNVCFCSILLLVSDQFDASWFQSSSTTIEGVEKASAACSCLPIAPFLPSLKLICICHVCISQFKQYFARIQLIGFI